MPGEELEDGLRAGAERKEKGINTILTRLGENVTVENEAQDVAEHYRNALREIHKNNIDAYISVKLTQLGLDLNEDLCYRNLQSIVEEAASLNNWVWIDMEQSGYVDRTLAMYKRIVRTYPNVGVCVQAYLYRTEKDIEELLPLSPAIRLVKGAYAESEKIAYPEKSKVDENYFKLVKLLLQNVKNHGVTLGVATHDPVLIEHTKRAADELGLSKKDYEFQLLYGIRNQEQLNLAAGGYRIRCLISYGSYWFPWYIRRLAERPANVWFVIKNMFG
jgi:proline dehydrogenase